MRRNEDLHRCLPAYLVVYLQHLLQTDHQHLLLDFHSENKYYDMGRLGEMVVELPSVCEEQ